LFERRPSLIRQRDVNKHSICAPKRDLVVAVGNRQLFGRYADNVPLFDEAL